MTETKLKERHPIVFAESLAIGAAAETLATAGATIPQNTGDVYIVVPSGDNIRWHPTGTPTTTWGHYVVASSVGMIPRDKVNTAKIISTDGADVTCIIIYGRGAGRQDAAYSLSAPY